MLQKALMKGQGNGMSVGVVLNELERGTRQLWVIHEEMDIQAAVVIALIDVPGRGQKLLVDLLAGNGMDEWVNELQDTLNQAAEVTGAFCIEASCRPGLAEYLKQNMGWKVKAIVLESPK